MSVTTHVNSELEINMNYQLQKSAEIREGILAEFDEIVSLLDKLDEYQASAEYFEMPFDDFCENEHYIEEDRYLDAQSIEEPKSSIFASVLKDDLLDSQTQPIILAANSTYTPISTFLDRLRTLQVDPVRDEQDGRK